MSARPTFQTLSQFTTYIPAGTRKPETRAAIVFSTTAAQRTKLYAGTWFTAFPADRRFAE